MKPLKLSALALSSLVASGVAAAVWWSDGGPDLASAVESAAPPAPSVPVAEVVVRRLSVKRTFIGHLEAVRTVEVTPRVDGLLINASVPEGGHVSEGDLLFRIDREPFEIRVAAARAQLERALALAGQAASNLTRAESLSRSGTASPKLHEEAQAARLSLDADVAVARALLREAEMRLGYTEIRAPLDGMVDRIEIHPGNQVVAGPASRLTRIVATDRLHVAVNIDEATYLHLSAAPTGSIAVEVEIGADPDHVLPGRLDFLSTEIDRQTGSLRARAVIDNPGNRLKPGLFALVRVPIEPEAQKILVSEAAIGTASGGRYVLTVDGAGAVVYRPVILGDASGALRVIDEGLKPGDRIILKGLVRPGMSVTPLLAPMPESETSVALSSSNGGES